MGSSRSPTKRRRLAISPDADGDGRTPQITSDQIEFHRGEQQLDHPATNAFWIEVLVPCGIERVRYRKSGSALKSIGSLFREGFQIEFLFNPRICGYSLSVPRQGKGSDCVLIELETGIPNQKGGREKPRGFGRGFGYRVRLFNRRERCYACSRVARRKIRRVHRAAATDSTSMTPPLSTPLTCALAC